jgi:hypothetical protein
MARVTTDELKTLVAIITLEGREVHSCPISDAHDNSSSNLFIYTNLFGSKRIIIPCMYHLPIFKDGRWVSCKEINSVEEFYEQTSQTESRGR